MFSKSVCKSTEHNKRTYPLNVDKDGVRLVQKIARKRENFFDKNQKNPILDLSNIVYILFDLETNGLSCHYNDIVEISATLADESGAPITEPFYSKCRPVRPVGYLQKFMV